MALFLIEAASSTERRWVWVVVGDLPPAQLDTGYCPTALDALEGYVSEVLAWARAAQAGEALHEYMPVLHPANFEVLAPTPDVLAYVEGRASFILTKIIPEYKQALRANEYVKDRAP